MTAARASRPALEDHLEELGLPDDFCDREAVRSRHVRELIESYRRQVPERQFLMGLMFAFLAVVEDLLAQTGEESKADALDQFPPAEQDPRGRPRNTLYLEGPERGIGLRRYYNNFERIVWNRLRRYDYPNCAPHATQAWPQHRDMLEQLFRLSPGRRLAVAEAVWDSVLALPQAASRAGAEITPRPFEKFLADFPNTQKGEPAGAVLQGMAFAYYRADAPNVTLETSKVGAGRAKMGGVGDIDGWSGGELVLSIEVKDRDIGNDDAEVTFGSFLTNLTDWPDSTAIVVARQFSEQAKNHLLGQKLHVLDRSTMAVNVALWDLRKQQLAMREFQYFLVRVQKHSGLVDRFREFLEANEIVI